MAATPPAHDDVDAAAVPVGTADDGDLRSVVVDGVRALQQRLEAHALDAATLVEEVTRSADACDEQALELHLRFLKNDVEPPVVEQVALGLIASVETAFDLQDETSDATLVTLLLLDQLLPAIKQRGRSDDSGRHQTRKTLLTYFKLATRRLNCETLDDQERTVFIQWCEHVLELFYTESPTPANGDEDSTNDAAERQSASDHHSFSISIASMLLALHDAMAQRTESPTAGNFKVVTLVWKVHATNSLNSL